MLIVGPVLSVLLSEICFMPQNHLIKKMNEEKELYVSFIILVRLNLVQNGSFL